MLKNFNELNYVRLDYESIKEKVEKLIEELKNASNYEKFLSCFKEIITIQNEIEEMYDYADIRNMRDLNDEYYIKEMEYWTLYKTKYDLLFNPFYEIIYKSEYKDKLENIIPINFFKSIEAKMKTTNEDIVEMRKVEKELIRKYYTLNKQTVLFNGEEKTLPYISGLFASSDRNTRLLAHNTINDYYLQHEDEYLNILYELIKIRTYIAKKCGYNNYCEYSLDYLRRFNYDYKDIKKFRDNVSKYIKPIIDEVNEMRKKELGIDKLEYYDTIFFKEMPEIKYKDTDLLNEFINVLNRKDPELSELYIDMLNNGYIDLEQRLSKVNYSITNYLCSSKVPVITGKYKYNYADVSITCHEFGHAYQKYLSSKEDEKYIISPLLKYPTFEIAEIFSHAMELILMDSVSSIFVSEDEKKYRFMKIYDLIDKLPYICLIDEFQETIYSKEDLTKEDINKIYFELSKKYHIDSSYIGHVNLEHGNYFFRQTHIFTDPFYYIDYALSYFGAFAIWSKCQEDLSYFSSLARVASYYPLKDLITKFSLPNPFVEENVSEVTKVLKNKLYL